MLNPSSLYSVLTPLYRITKLFGLTPFKINYNICKESKISLLWSICFMFFINIYAFIAIDYNYGYEDEFIAIVIGVLDAYVGQLSMFCGIVFGCIFRNDIVFFLQDITILDSSMHRSFHIDLKREYRKSKIYSITGLLATLTILIAAITYTTLGSTDLFTFERFGEFLGYTGPYLISILVNLQFCTLILCLKQRFGWLNKKITTVTENMLKNLNEYDTLLNGTLANRSRPTTHIVASGCIQDRALYFIEKIKLKHYKLCSISKKLNRAYSVPLLLIILQNFVTIIVSLYYSGRYVIIDNVIPVDYLIYAGLQFTLASGQILVLVISCSITALEARNMAVLIHNIMLLNVRVENTFKEELQLEITLFSLQILHHNVEFTACNLFIINETLLFSIAAAIGTYLIIVVQFEVANVQRCGNDPKF